MKKSTITTVSVVTVLLLAAGIGGSLWFYFKKNSCSSIEDSSDHTSTTTREKPNVIIILSDDTGYGDFQCYGHPTQEWGAVDKMAEEGLRFTQFTSVAGTCSPSRAALLTGRYNVRTGVFGYAKVFTPFDNTGLPKSEITIAEALKDLGYVTGMVGKWHLGINEKTNNDGQHLPHKHGFDYVGTNIPFTHHWLCEESQSIEAIRDLCFLYDNSTIVEQPVNMKTVTKRLVDDSISFLQKNAASPFFFYLSLPQTHPAMFCDVRFCGKSKRGSYGDNVNEMAWAIGEVLNEIKALGIDKDTLTLYLSDHGPAQFGCPDEGSTGLLRGGKLTTWEGGFRVPAIARWPGTIPAGTVSKELISTLDILPTVLHLAGSPDYHKKKDITIDGRIIADIVRDNKPRKSRKSSFYYCSNRLMAVRYKNFKIHYYTLGNGDNVISDSSNEDCRINITRILQLYDCYGDNAIRWDPPLIFDLDLDPQERLRLNSSLSQYRELLSEVEDIVLSHEATVIPTGPLFDSATGGHHLAPCCNPPLCTCNYKSGNDKDFKHKPQKEI